MSAETPSSSPRRTLATPFLLAVGGALALAVPGVALNLWEWRAAKGDVFVPLLRRAQDWLPALPLLAALLTARSVWRGRDQLRSLSGTRRALYLVGLALLQALVVAALGFGGVVSRHDWLFGPPVPYASARSPDGKRMAYATMDCFLECSVIVHVAEAGSVWMHEVQRENMVVADSRPTLTWSADSRDAHLEGVSYAPPLSIGGWH